MMARPNHESHPRRPRPMNTPKCPGPASHHPFHPMILSRHDSVIWNHRQTPLASTAPHPHEGYPHSSHRPLLLIRSRPGRAFKPVTPPWPARSFVLSSPWRLLARPTTYLSGCFMTGWRRSAFSLLRWCAPASANTSKCVTIKGSSPLHPSAGMRKTCSAGAASRHGISIICSLRRNRFNGSIVAEPNLR